MNVKTIAASLIIALFAAGCGSTENAGEDEKANNHHVEIVPTLDIQELNPGLSSIAFQGDDGFETFLAQGGAQSDEDVYKFLANRLSMDASAFTSSNAVFGCSTIAVKNEAGEPLFGRNFDWENAEALIVYSKPDQGLASISTVNMDFISTANISDETMAMAALYAPLDGMNEAGLVVSVNMIQDNATIEQQSDKADITTTTAIRLLLNQASSVEEAIDLLHRYDMHASMGMMVHFAIADARGKHVVIEYVNDEMKVIDTPVVTNFYLSSGDKNGIGTAQSHKRYDILMKQLDENKTMSMEQVRDAIDSVSKDNFNEFEATQWSVVYNQITKEIRYYHREQFDKAYIFHLQGSGGK